MSDNMVSLVNPITLAYMVGSLPGAQCVPVVIASDQGALPPPGPVTATAVNGGASITSDQNAAVAGATGLRLYGYSLQEDAAGTATLRIMHGATVGGGVAVELISLVANQSKSDYWGPEGIAVPNGVSIDWISGSFKMSLKTKVV